MFAAANIAAVVAKPDSGRPLGVVVVLLRLLSVDDRLSVTDEAVSYEGGDDVGVGPEVLIDDGGDGFFVVDEEDE